MADHINAAPCNLAGLLEDLSCCYLVICHSEFGIGRPMTQKGGGSCLAAGEVYGAGRHHYSVDAKVNDKLPFCSS